MAQYSFLQPIQLGKLTAKNRIVMSAMIKAMCTEDGVITDDYIAYYAERAAGGTGIIVPGAMVVDSTWPYIFPKQPWLDDDKVIPGLKKAVDAVHAHGALFICQLWHAGLHTATGTPLGKPVAEWSLDEIHAVQDKYVAAAGRAKAAGADGVEFHAAHTFLPNQFLSPHFNKRSDQYGADTVENAARFSTEILARIRDSLCDDHFMLTAKINGDDFVEGGVLPEWSAQAGALMEKAGVVMITVNAGGANTQVTGMSDDGHHPEGWKVPLAMEMKKHVSIPVAANGSLRHPQFIDAAIRSGEFDLAAIGRGLLAEPQWVNKVMEGREDEIRFCVSCMHCFNPHQPGHSRCSLNPWAQNELMRPELKQDGAGRRVLVLGAGPAGMEAAITLAERGFAVGLYEKSQRLGGQINLAAIPPAKEKFTWLLEYYDKQPARLGIDLHLGTALTPDEVVAMQPYAVVVATGSTEFVPDIPGIDGPLVVGSGRILESPEKPSGKHVVVLGGLTGLETAMYLRQSGNEVTVLEMKEDNVIGMENRLANADCAAQGIPLMLGHTVTAIEDGLVRAVRSSDGAEVEFPADLVVRALGVVPDTSLYEALKDRLPRVFPVGDCAGAGKLAHAVEAGSRAAYAIS